MFPEVIRIPKKIQPPHYDFIASPQISDVQWCTTVSLFRTPYIFLNRVTGIPVRMERWMNAKGEYEVAWIAEGYRCQECQRIFFSPDLDGFHHECSGDE